MTRVELITRSDLPTTCQAVSMTSTHSNTIEAWQRKDGTRSSQNREPYAFSEILGIEITIKDLAQMAAEQLKTIATEMFNKSTAINGAISAEFEVLKKLNSDQPMAIHKAKRAIAGLRAKKNAVRIIGVEAGRLARKRNGEVCNKPRERLVSSQSQLNAFDQAQAKMKYYKNKIWYKMLADEIGMD
jgi:hypothetical protein